MQITLAAALLRRKELNQKVEMLKNIKNNDLFYQIHGERVRVEQGLDELRGVKFPKLNAHQVTEEFDFYARQLRMLDAHIQRVNWSTMLEIEDSIDQDYQVKK